MTTGSVSVTQVRTGVGTIEMRRGGTGAPLVYLHSAAGEGAGLSFLDDLATSYDVIAPMSPGFGESEGVDLIDDMEDGVFHLLDLFDRLELRAPAVVGLSLGAWMAAEVATRYPERISRLVLVNPAGLYIPGAEIKDIFGRTPGEMAHDLFADLGHPLAQVMLRMDRTLSAGAASFSIPFDALKPQLRAQAATARIGWNPYLHNPRLRRRLHRITAPTLVVRAAHDTLIPAPHAETYAREIPGARLVEVPDAAHMIVWERPAELAAVIRAFLAGSPEQP